MIISRILEFFLGRERFFHTLCGVLVESFKKSKYQGNTMVFTSKIKLSIEQHDPKSLAISEALQEAEDWILEELKDVDFTKIYLSDIRVLARKNQDTEDVYDNVIELPDASAEVESQ